MHPSQGSLSPLLLILETVCELSLHPETFLFNMNKNLEEQRIEKKPRCVDTIRAQASCFRYREVGNILCYIRKTELG